MNEKQRAKAHKILEYYGDDKERLKAMEELGELVTAIAKGHRVDISEEIADVLIVIEHMMYINDIDYEEIDQIINYKLNREFGRIRQLEERKGGTQSYEQ